MLSKFWKFSVVNRYVVGKLLFVCIRILL